ncbi:hypothetical protein [Nocardia sp. CY41]|uniref:hypothetical protein n=1 Tax=Nocardia sp. CY41 TaxID=2608686 RepID=UPI00135BE8F0|nr:hypothetical protein [Nocardia sp. CY41]
MSLDGDLDGLMEAVSAMVTGYVNGLGRAKGLTPLYWQLTASRYEAGRYVLMGQIGGEHVDAAAESIAQEWAAAMNLTRDPEPLPGEVAYVGTAEVSWALGTPVWLRVWGVADRDVWSRDDPAWRPENPPPGP